MKRTIIALTLPLALTGCASGIVATIEGTHALAAIGLAATGLSAAVDYEQAKADEARDEALAARLEALESNGLLACAPELETASAGEAP